MFQFCCHLLHPDGIGRVLEDADRGRVPAECRTGKWRKLKHSETAFLSPVSGGWNLRWFTPEQEVELCGHATLASAFVLWKTGRVIAGYCS